ncbi:hypothetical protein [Polaribacter septentrionalilitoris]|uniref:hypothetical protein n=1 Tax=Polaribacter septentrionalilitoris TaxID=2494657 RepID=UPI00135B2ED4|nr:hypothetical protein [Polaribacter septentrionalilitoris]
MKIHQTSVLILIALFTILGCKTQQFPKSKITKNDYVFLEAEKTESNLQKWQLVKKGDANYVKGASNGSYLEFMGNKPITGKPNSPLEYTLTASENGNFQLMLMSSKRLEGVKSDWCNDAFVRLSGDFESASQLKTKDLKRDIKILQDGNDETAELEWHWASTAEKDRHVYNQFVYRLKKGEQYTLTISGRSKRFSIDYIILYNVDKFNAKKAKELFKIQ